MIKKNISCAPTITVVVPLYFEEGNIGLLMERLYKVLESMDASYEIILVDDGSRDNTWGLIEKESVKNNSVKGICLSRNFGHQHALLAGLVNASGQAIISMDGDLQNPPEIIPNLIDKWREGYAIVNTIRRDKRVTSLFKRITSKYFYKLFSMMTDVKMSEGSSDFRLIDRVVLENILEFKDADLFLRGAVQWLGFKKVTIPYEVEKRHSGESKYNIWKMLKFSRNAIISFSNKPLIMGVWIGLITGSMAFVEIVYIIIQYLLGNTVPGWASTVGIIAFLFGVLFFMLGIIGAYLARIHILLQNRPRFVIQKQVNIKGALIERD